jgi:hypothetical protein
LLAGGRMLTFDSASLPFEAQENFTLITGVCTAAPNFAVFAKKTEGTSALVLETKILISEIFDFICFL